MYLKFGLCVQDSKSSPCYTIQNEFFFSELCPFFDLNFLSSIKHPTAKRWHLHAVHALVVRYFRAIHHNYLGLGGILGGFSPYPVVSDC